MSWRMDTWKEKGTGTFILSSFEAGRAGHKVSVGTGQMSILNVPVRLC